MNSNLIINKIFGIIALFASLILLFMHSPHALAQDTSKSSAQNPEKLEAFLDKFLPGSPHALAQDASKTGPQNPEELEAFLDEFFSKKMKELHIPGAVIVVVKDGEIFLAKGYGYADIEKKKPVIPEETVFLACSVSKLFTATAVMQLYEKGLLDLNDNVNKYLKLFQLEKNYPEPVTIANLLTHTGGFDERLVGLVSKDPNHIMPLGEYLEKNMPPRALPPGDVISYSNHGFALAGYLVEEISSIPFAQYINENILQPLDMHRSSFLQPPPQQLVSSLAVGYAHRNGTYNKYPPIYSSIGPAGTLITTATDMASFMIAHLQHGRFGENRILNENTADEMHRQHFTHHPRLSGLCYGFHEYFKNDLRAILHDGDLLGYSSRLFLLPDHNLGFYLAYNGRNMQLRIELTKILLDHYYPVSKEKLTLHPPADFEQRASRFTGSYRYNRYARHSIEKLMALFMSAAITISDDKLVVKFPAIISDEPSHWVEVEPLLFQKTDGEGFMVYREDNRDHITHVFLNFLDIPIAAEKLAWYEIPSFQICWIGFIIFIFLSFIIALPVRYFMGRKRKYPSDNILLARYARVLATSVVTLNLIFLIGLILSFALLTDEFLSSLPPTTTGLLVIPIMTSILTIGLIIFSILTWKNRYWGVLGRLYYSLITLTCISFIPFLYYWNLLGFNY